MSEEATGTAESPEQQAGGGVDSGTVESQQGEGSGGVKSQPSKTDGDPRFAGKSQEELVSIIREQEKHIGRQGNALGEVQTLKQAIADLRDYVVASNQPRERYQPEQQPTAGPEFDLTNPEPYVANVAARIVESRERQRMAAEQSRLAAEAQVNYYEGREAAMRRNPDYYDGIERDVETAVQQSFASGSINSAQLRSPQTWEMAAWVLRKLRGEEEKAIPRRTAVKAVDIEKPGRSATTNDEDEIILDEHDKETMKQQGWSEKEAKEIIRLEMKAERDGLSQRRRN